MFAVLGKILKEQGIEVSEFWENDKALDEDLYEVLKVFEGQIQWKSGPKVLLRRIRRIGRNKTFSARETKRLRKLINSQKRYGYIDYEEIKDEFPGKSIEMLKEKYNEKYLYLTTKRTYQKRKVL